MRCSAKPGLVRRLLRRTPQSGRDRDRLDWLTWRMCGSETRRLVGVLNDTADIAEWRRAIDREMNIGSAEGALARRSEER